MRNYKDEDAQQCFINDSFEQISQTQALDIKIQITKKINQQMPANQLRALQRPQNMNARTFHLDRPLYLLPQWLNESQYEGTSEVTCNKQKIRISNSQNLNIEQYFSRKKYRCIYNKLSTYRSDSKSFLGKLKGIDQLIDYNWKSFKQLEYQINILNENKDQRIDSDFECGNLCRVYINLQISQKQYFMLIQNDINTYGYNNWFFFRIRNQQKGIRKFNIINLIKKTNFYNQGMLISIFSLKKKHYQNIGWYKGGNNIIFGSVNLHKQHHQNQYYYSLSFQYDFQYQSDQVFFALNQPYSYTRMIQFLQNIKSKNHKKKIQIKPLGYSISNNIIPLVKINNQKSRNQNAIIFLGRQHPCQTVGSFISEKIIKYLMSDNPITNFMVNNFDIYLIPMVNPDGVIHGMARTNMAGLDLNRQWGDNILKELTPQTIKIKQFINNLSKIKKIKYMIDLHGHGKKLNTFFFCCNKNDKQKDNNHLITLCMKQLQNKFNLYNCTFGISKDKQNTIRSQIKSMGIKNSYTLQTSLYGWKNQQNQIKHYNQYDYQSIGQNLIKSIYLLQADTQSTLQYLGISKEYIIKLIPLILEIKQKQQKNQFQNTDIMSDSDPQADKLDVKDLINKCQNKIIKKKLQQTYSIKKNINHNKYKKLSTIQTSKQSNKNLSLRQSYGPTFNPISCIRNQGKDRQFLHKSDNTNQKQIQRKAVTTIKFHQKRRQISQRQKEDKIDRKKQIRQSLNITRNKIRARIKTQSFNQDKKKTCRLKIKNQQPPSSLKAQKIQLNLKCKTQPDQIAKIKKKSQLSMTFNQLKKQSLNMLLTDTISILKFKNDRIGNPNPIKNVSLETKKQAIQATKRSQIPKDFLQKQILSAEIIFQKAKYFNNLANVKSNHNSKFSRQLNSVYYHFPVL